MSLPIQFFCVFACLFFYIMFAVVAWTLFVGFGALVYATAKMLPVAIRTAARGTRQLWQMIPWSRRSNLPEARMRRKS